MTRKAIIVSAPSGAGKSTIVQYLMKHIPGLVFSVSACSREMRENEVNGVHYYFISPEEFRNKIENDELVEWQEVYPGSYYGTLKSELERILNEGKIPIFDVDVVGGVNLKKYFGTEALAVFIRPPSVEELEARLRNRSTESEESLAKRLGKVKQEMEFAGRFDRVIVNDNLGRACKEVVELVKDFLFNHEGHKD